MLAEETRAEEVAIVHIAFDDVSLRLGDGARMPGVTWREGMEDGMEIGVEQPRDVDRPRWRVPMTLLVAGAPFEHVKRYDEPGKPEAIAGRIGNAVDWMKAGKAEGVVIWFLPLDGAKASRVLVDAVAQKTAGAVDVGR